MPQCAFCLREAKLTGEHIWSDWICELYPDIRVIFRKWSAGDSGVSEWETGSMDHTAKVVCKRCNEGWMSNLESCHAKPAMKDAILSEERTILDTEKLAAISRFAFKTAVIGDHTERKKLPFFPSQVRRRFANTLKIPDGFQVWIGCIGENDRHHGVFRRRYWHTPQGAPAGLKLFVVTWGVGRFIFQATATRWNRGSYRKHLLPFLTQDRNWDSFSIPIWPMLTGPLKAQWPPGSHLSDNMLDERGYLLQTPVPFEAESRLTTHIMRGLRSQP
jgi:hypothetical protein